MVVLEQDFEIQWSWRCMIADRFFEITMTPGTVLVVYTFIRPPPTFEPAAEPHIILL